MASRLCRLSCQCRIFWTAVGVSRCTVVIGRDFDDFHKHQAAVARHAVCIMQPMHRAAKDPAQVYRDQANESGEAAVKSMSPPAKLH
jgi:hypothetical protein